MAQFLPAPQIRRGEKTEALASPEAGRARAAFEAAFREAGGVLGEAASAVDVRVTVSENATDYLLVEQARKGDERLVWLAAWK